MQDRDELDELLNGPASRFSFLALRSLLDTWPDPSTLDRSLGLASARLRSWPAWTRNLSTESPEKFAAYVGTPGWRLARWIRTTLDDEEDGEAVLASIISHPCSSRIRGLDLAIFGRRILEQLRVSANFPGLRHLKLTTVDQNIDGILQEIRHNLPRELKSLSIVTPPGEMPSEFVDVVTNNEWQPSLRKLSLVGLTRLDELKFAEGCRRPLHLIRPDRETLPVMLKNKSLTGELRRLDLYRCDDAAVRLVSRSAHLSSLRSLKMVDAQVSAAGIFALKRAGFITGLGALTVLGSPLFEEGWAALSSLPLDRLRSLSLRHTGGNLLGARALADSGRMPNLTSLEVSNNFIEAGGLDAIIRSDLMDRLACLRANCTGKSAVAAASLASRPRPRLRHLHFGNDDIGDGGVEELAKCSGDWALATLNLLGSQIGDRGVERLVSSGRFSRLRRLLLSSNHITSVGARSIAESSLASRLYDLSLAYNQLGDDGALALARSERMVNLVFLDLQGNGISVDGSQALSLAPLAKRLEGVKIAFNEEFVAPWRAGESIRPPCRANPLDFLSH